MSKKSKEKRKKPVDWEVFAFPKHPPKRVRGKKETELRRQVFIRDGGICRECGNYAPLYDNGVFNVFTCGHKCHLKSRGASGEDTLENLVWKCPNCHLNLEHGPQWSSQRRSNG